jgi:hypothetical protein
MKHFSFLKQVVLTILFVTLAGYVYSQPLPEPMAYWGMSGEDTIVTEYIGGNHGIMKNYDAEDTTFVTGQVGNALYYDADTNSNYVEAPIIPFSADGEYTICFWMNLDTVGSPMLYGANNEWSYYPFSVDSAYTYNNIRFRVLIRGDKTKPDWIRFEVVDNSQPEGDYPPYCWVRPSKTSSTDDDNWLGGWTHISGIKYQDSMKIYLNANPETYGRNIYTHGGTYADEGKTYIGGAISGGELYGTTWHGMIDEVMIFDNALTVSQLAQVTSISTPVEKLKAKEAQLSHYPNPVTNGATISYTLQNEGSVSLDIINLSGQTVRALVSNEYQGLGTHTVPWDCRLNSGDIAPAGLYFYQLKIDGKRSGIGKMMLTK